MNANRFIINYIYIIFYIYFLDVANYIKVDFCQNYFRFYSL